MRTPSRTFGFAYIGVMLVLLLLTIIAIAFVQVTQNEKRIANNERSAQRVQYAAESGIHIAVAKYIVSTDVRPMQLEFREPGRDRPGRVAIDQRIEVTPLVPIANSPCNYCQVNPEDPFVRVTQVLNSTATRVGAVNGEVLASQSLSVMIGVQPARPSAASSRDAMVRLGDHEIVY